MQNAQIAEEYLQGRELLDAVEILTPSFILALAARLRTARVAHPVRDGNAAGVCALRREVTELENEVQAPGSLVSVYNEGLDVITVTWRVIHGDYI